MNEKAMKLPTLDQISLLLSARALEPYTCVAMARRAIAEGSPVNTVLSILSVDADKLRPISPKLYAYILNR